MSIEGNGKSEMQQRSQQRSQQRNQQQRWNQRYLDGSNDYQQLTVASVLANNQHLLPRSGLALDLACGLGQAAIVLSEIGLQTTAWDISDVAIQHLQQAAQQRHLNLNAEQRDVIAQPPEPNSFDVMLVVRFLDRPLIPRLIDAIKPGGLIFYQTFIQDKDPTIGPGNPEFLLHSNELLQMFSTFKLLAYREEALQGDVLQGFRNEAMLVAQKPV